MSKTKITNVSPGARIVQVKSKIKNAIDGSPSGESLTIGSRQTVEVDLLDAEDPVFKGMVEDRQLVIGELSAETPKERQEREERRVLNSPNERARLDNAMAAGANPALADQPNDDGEGEEGEDGEGEDGQPRRAATRGRSRAR